MTDAQDTIEEAQSRPTTRSITWRPGSDQTTGRRRCTALFRRTATGWQLQHVRTVTLRQRGPTTSDLDPNARPIDLPPWVRRQVGLDENAGGGQAHV
jgi:hypothetical protein